MNADKVRLILSDTPYTLKYTFSVLCVAHYAFQLSVLETLNAGSMLLSIFVLVSGRKGESLSSKSYLCNVHF